MQRCANLIIETTPANHSVSNQRFLPHQPPTSHRNPYRFFGFSPRVESQRPTASARVHRARLDSTTPLSRLDRGGEARRALGHRAHGLGRTSPSPGTKRGPTTLEATADPSVRTRPADPRSTVRPVFAVEVPTSGGPKTDRRSGSLLPKTLG